jgi:hypothetical protein
MAASADREHHRMASPSVPLAMRLVNEDKADVEEL